MVSLDGTHWSTDRDVFAALPGGPAVIDWFGFVPSFHDAELDCLSVANGTASLTLKTFRMTGAVDATGVYVLGKHARVTLDLFDVTGLSLKGNAASVLIELGVRRIDAAPSGFDTCEGPRTGDVEVSFESSYGLMGSIYVRGVRFSVSPA